MSGKERRKELLEDWLREYFDIVMSGFSCSFSESYLAAYLEKKINESDCIWNKRGKKKKEGQNNEN